MYCSGTSFFVLLLNGGNKVRLQIKLIKKQSDLICGYMVWRCCGLTERHTRIKKGRYYEQNRIHQSFHRASGDSETAGDHVRLSG